MTEALDDHGHERHVWWVLAASAAIGFAVGALVYPMGTDNVESAQVVAGLVSYPPANPMHAYHTSVYTILIQAAAILLGLGASEWALSVLFSGLQGALSCAALSAATLALSQSPVTALAVPVLLLRFRQAVPDWPPVYIAAFHGHFYPNLFPNHAGIYGVVGLFWIFLVFGLFALRKVRTASVLLGLMPAIHPGLTPACLVGALAAGWFLRRELQPWRATVLRHTAIGLAIFAATALWQVAARWEAAPNVARAEVDRVASVFVAAWDDHSTPLSPGDWKWFFESEAYTLLMGIGLLTVCRRFLPAAARVLVVAVLAITLVGIANAILLNASPFDIPWAVRALMVRRWLNLSSWAFVVMAMGLLGQLAFVRRDLLAAGAFVFASVAVLSGYSLSITGAASMALSEEDVDGALRSYLFPATIVGASLLLAWLRAQGRGLTYGARQSPAVLSILAMLLAPSLSLHHFRHVDEARLRGADAYTDVLDVARGREGLLLTGDELWWAGRIQLRTRRPLLLDLTQLNMLLKVPTWGPRMEYILKRVHGVQDMELGRPPRLDELWPEYDLARWQEIRREFGVTDVLVGNDVVLALPRVFEGEVLSLYTIP